MKNFFKKLSFVLAIAMVLTSLTPATASAATKNYIKLNGGKKVTKLTAYVGGTVRNLDYVVGGKSSGVKGTWKSSDTSVLTVDKYGVVTPTGKNGHATVTFTPADKSGAASVYVKTRTRAANLHIYDAEVYATGEKVKLEDTTVELTVGEEKDLKVTLPMYKKSIAAGAVRSSYYSYAEVSDETVVKVTKNNNRSFDLKALKAGEATVTIVANQTTAANVRANDYYVEQTFTVKVGEELAAKQTGVKKITVTGADLTDKVADYTLKRGNVTVAVSSVELNEAKTAAVLVTGSSKYPAGKYTVTFNKVTTDEFEVTDGKLTSIVVDEKLILNEAIGSGSNYTGTVKYKVYNQFDEELNPTGLNAQCTLGVTGTPTNGSIPVTNISQYYTLGTTGKVIVIDTNGSGVSVEQEVVLSAKAVAAEVTVKGVFNTSTNKFVELKANTAYNNLAVAVEVKDQYGNVLKDNYTAVSPAGISLIANPGLTGLSLTNTDFIASYNDTAKAHLLPLNDIAKASIKAGTFNITFVLIGVAKTTSDEFSVASTAKVASIEIYPKDTVYYGESVEFGYTATDSEGNEVTSLTLLEDPLYGVNLPAGFSWSAPKYDDVAVLTFNGTAGMIDVPAGQTAKYTGMVSTRDFSSTKTVTFDYCAKAVPTYVMGIKDKDLGIIFAADATIGLNYTNVLINDQYGRAMSNDAVKAAINGAYSLEISKATNNGKFNLTGTVINEGVVTLGIDTAVATLTAIAAGSETIKVVLKNGTTALDDNTFTFKGLGMSDFSSFELSDIPTIAVAGTINGLTTVAQTDTVVKGVTADGTKVALPKDASYYTVVSELVANGGYTVNGTSASSAVGTDSGKVAEKSYDVKVVINDGKGTEIVKTVTVMAAAPAINKVTADSTPVKIASTAAVTTGTLDNLFGVFDGKINAYDQYGYKMEGDGSIASAGHYASVRIFDLALASSATKVENNNTRYAHFSASLATNDQFSVELTFDSGVKFTFRVVVE